MPNRFHYPRKAAGKGGAVNMAGKPAAAPFPEKAPKAAGLPGKAQPAAKTDGVRKVKAHVVSQGI